MNGAPKRTLERALKIVNTIERLAIAVGASVDDVRAYLAGDKPVPTKVFITALNIVATGRDPRE